MGRSKDVEHISEDMIKLLEACDGSGTFYFNAKNLEVTIAWETFLSNSLESDLFVFWGEGTL